MAHQSVVQGLVATAIVVLAGTGYAQTIRLEPSLNVRQTYSDNARSGSSGGSDWVTEVAPALGLSAQGARVDGRLNARLRNIYSANDSSRTRNYITLDGRGEVEAVEDLFFVEADASVRRDASLFDAGAGDDIVGGSSREETRTYSIAPRLQFRLGSLADGVIRYRHRWLDSGRSGFSAGRLGQWDASLANPNALGRLGWGLSYVRNDTTYSDSEIEDVVRETTRATLYYNVSSQLRFRGIVGQESNDYGTYSESGSIVGGGFDWFPSTRTSISGTTEDRIFGQGYDLSVSHRRARSSWRLSYGKDLSSSLRRSDGFLPGEQLVIGPDGGLVDEDLDGLPDTLPVFVPAQFVTNAQYVQKRLRASVGLIGVRNTLTFTVLSTDRTRLENLSISGFEGDFGDSDRVRNRSASLALRHRLSGNESLNGSLTRYTAERMGGDGAETNRWIASVGYTTRLGPNTTGSLVYRHQRADGRSGGADFTQNLLSANLGIRF